VAVYLICVAIATGFWFLNALSKTYTVDLMATVKYVNLPYNKTLASSLPEQFDLTVEAHGFTILRNQLIFLIMPLQFDVNDLTNNRMVESKKSYFAFPTRQFLNELSYRLSNDLKITSINPDTLIFRFDKLGQKRLEVKPQVKFTLKKQFRKSGNVSVVPDSVTVNGPKVTIDSMQFAYTQSYQFIEADKTILTDALITSAKELDFEPKQVKMKIPIEEYTEAEQSVTVLLNNEPDGVKIKLFPSKVKVSFLVGLSRFSEIHPEDFRLTVSYDDILQGRQRLKINAESVPSFLYELKIFPEELEYLIEK
jgi:hypothetical protein